MREFTYDVKFAGVMIIRATDEYSAENNLSELLESIQFDLPTGSEDAKAKLVGFSIDIDDANGPELIEIDGIPIE